MKTQIKKAGKVNYKGKDYIVVTYLVKDERLSSRVQTLWIPIPFIKGL